MTKKQKKELDNSRRGSWFGVNPCSKVVPDKKKKANKEKCRKKVEE